MTAAILIFQVSLLMSCFLIDMMAKNKFKTPFIFYYLKYRYSRTMCKLSGIIIINYYYYHHHYILLLFSETRSDLKPTLTLNVQPSCLHHPCARITGVDHPAWLIFFITILRHYLVQAGLEHLIFLPTLCIRAVYDYTGLTSSRSLQ